MRKHFLFLMLIISLSWVFIFFGENASLSDYFTVSNLKQGQKFLSDLLGLTVDQPAYLSAEHWKSALQLTWETLQMSILAIGFSGIGMLVTVIPAARPSNGSLLHKETWLGWLVFWFTRGLYIFSRAVPELVWAMLIIFIIKPGLLPGALALALHNFGIVGKLCAEVVEDLDMKPIESLRSSGAGSWQVLVYGILPAVTPKFLTYLLYRWEVIIRTTIVVGFVGAGGLGHQFKLNMSWFQYTEITLLLMCYILLVIIADIVSEAFRKWAR